MIEAFEKTLAKDGDLNETRLRLLNELNCERQAKYEQIEHDYRIATLISEAVRTEPKGSQGYGIARGIVNRLKAKHDPDSGKIAEALLHSAET